ncbi:helix-turn-helix domain-containing protein [Emticicia sp. BO119]|uniref:AraC family transcriptional regulator n=1 Tax=Emticicia sp. BO119 TaxID=2757768 RepID=UPI0015F0EDF7|nr:helix-turn-helix domain-containing protein [Emticicia sp. BO119]MBA4853870.1 AraC family transcriptional regulator [Emticicia sp. BO119]
MKLELYPIFPELQPYIKAICSIESDIATPFISPFRVLPDACVELFINFNNSQDTLATITGRRIFDNSQSFVISRMSDFMDVQMKSKTGFISVCFYPDTAYLFFQLPMNQVADSLTNLQYLWQSEAIQMEEEVGNADRNEQRAVIIQQYLLRQLIRQRFDKTIAYCVQEINKANTPFSVTELANKVGLSQRQLSRKFNYCIGLSTKEFIHINRFIASLVYLKKYPAMSLTDIAYESGYYDQAHFIHDYKSFAGLTPGAVLNAGNLVIC